jgi:hypothetical protein
VQNPPPLPDDSLVVKGGLGRTWEIDIFDEPDVGTITGTSARSNPGKTPKELSEGLPHGQIRITTVGKIREAGGDVIPTRRSPTKPDHATITGLDLDEINRIFSDPIPNPAKKPRR